MGKNIDKLGKYEDWKAPWETEAGEDTKIDKSRLKRLIFNLKLGEATALDNLDEAKESVKTANEERDTAKSEAEKASPDEANKKIARLEKENAELKSEKEAREKADAHEALRKEVIGDLDQKYAKYVQGDDKKALEESLEQVRADFGLNDEDGDDDADEDSVRTQPRSRLRSVADPAAGKGEPELDPDKIADQILSAGNVF